MEEAAPWSLVYYVPQRQGEMAAPENNPAGICGSNCIVWALCAMEVEAHDQRFLELK